MTDAFTLLTSDLSRLIIFVTYVLRLSTDVFTILNCEVTLDVSKPIEVLIVSSELLIVITLDSSNPKDIFISIWELLYEMLKLFTFVFK